MGKFDIRYAISQIPFLAKYVPITLFMALISMTIALLISIVLLIINKERIKILYPLSKFYVSFFRGTPVVVQMFILYYGLPQVFPVFKEMTGLNATIIGLSLNSSAYMTESLSGAFDSVDKGQMEAALSIGMTRWQGIKRIVLPQAIKVAIPVLANDFINLIKMSSLAFMLGVRDIMAATQLQGAATYKFLECYIAAASIYYVVIMFFVYIQRIIERKMSSAQ